MSHHCNHLPDRKPGRLLNQRALRQLSYAGFLATGTFLLGWLFAHSTCIAQPLPTHYREIPMAQLAASNHLPANWTHVDSAFIHPEKRNVQQVLPGKRMLIGQAGQAMKLPLMRPNFKLFIQYVLSPESRATVFLPGGATILLCDTGQDAAISGFTGHFPSQNAGKMAGLIQTLAIDYEGEIPHLPGKACLNELKINGVAVQQGQFFNQVDQPTGGIQVEKGTLIVRAIGIQEMEYRRPVSLENLTYKVYNDPWDSRRTDLLGESGTSPVLTAEVAAGKNTFNLVYEGDLQVDEEGDYDFNVRYIGAYCQLSIDGNVILDEGQSEHLDPHSTRVKLDAGGYKFKIWYSKLPWKQAGFGVTLGKSAIRHYDLHAASSLPEIPAKPFIIVNPKYKQPEMIRSFLQFPGEPHTRTHCLSVGTPAGRHYAIDLNRGALLQVWSGEFANTTEMWYERGQPQILLPEGQIERISGRSSFVNLLTPQSPWLDSAAVQFKGYQIDSDGFPAITYVLGASVIQDLLRSTPKGITRTITPVRNALPTNYVLLAEGSQIAAIDKGLYSVDGRYYIKIDQNQPPVIRRSGEKSELLMRLDAPVTYAILW